MYSNLRQTRQVHYLRSFSSQGVDSLSQKHCTNHRTHNARSSSKQHQILNQIHIAVSAQTLPHNMTSDRLRLVLLKNRTVPEDTYHHNFTKCGHVAEFIPLLNHSPVDVSSTVSFLRSDRFHAAPAFIITSQRAVEVFHECLRLISVEDAKMATRIRQKCGYTVGPATFEVLMENGFVDVRGGSNAGNGAKLADIILSDRQSQRGPFDRDSSGEIIFFTGEIRKDIIPVKLSQNGMKVFESVIYKTEPRSTILDDYVNALQSPISWLIFFSPQATESIVDHLAIHGLPEGTKVACIGPTTQEYLIQKGLTPHVTAASPTAKSLLDGISECSA